jgi:pyochelin synthetase
VRTLEKTGGQVPPKSPGGMESRSPGPADSLERSIRRLWRELLGRSDFGMTDNFFDIGGSSLLLLEVQAAIRQMYGYQIPLAALFSAPTVAGVALLLRGPQVSVPGTLVRLSSAEGPPVFFFHPLGGSTAVYRPLAVELNDYRCYGLQALGLSAGCQPQDRLDEMIGRYLEGVRAVAGDSPNAFIGYSLGSVFALAAARRLADAGAPPPTVVLLDPPTPLQPDLMEPYQAIAYALNLDLDCEAISVLPVSQGIEVIYRAGLQAGAYGRALPVTTLQAMFETARANIRAAGEYVPGSYLGRVVLIRSSNYAEPIEWLREERDAVSMTVPLPHAVLLDEKGARRIAQMLVPLLGHAREEA